MVILNYFNIKTYLYIVITTHLLIMFIVLDINEFNINNLFYHHEKVKNTVMENSKFLRILYSNELFTLNGIFIKFSFTLNTIEKAFNKYKCFFDHKNLENHHIILKLKMIENHILTRCHFDNKIPNYRITEQLNNNYLKIFNEQTQTQIYGKEHDFILKIYGVWETDCEYGVTYKFISI